MKIYLADKSHKKVVVKLFNELRATHSGKQITEEGSLFDEIISDDNIAVFLLEDDDIIIGFATLYQYPKLSDKRAFVSELMISAPYQSKGYGSKFLDYIKNYCKVKGVTTLKISSGLENERAHQFYEKNGGSFKAKEFKFYLD